LLMDFRSLFVDYTHEPLVRVYALCLARVSLAPLSNRGYRSLAERFRGSDQLALVRATAQNQPAANRATPYLDLVDRAGFKSGAVLPVYPRLIEQMYNSPQYRQQTYTIIPVTPISEVHVIGQVQRLMASIPVGNAPPDSTIFTNTVGLATVIAYMKSAFGVILAGEPKSLQSFQRAGTT